MRILLVKDNEVSAEALTVRLKKCVTSTGHGEPEVCITTTLREGLLKSQAWQPDITLLDPRLPDSPEWHDTITHIREFVPPVIIVTGIEKTPAFNEACLLAGAQRVFYKPWEMSAVEELVGSMARSILRAKAAAATG